MSDTAITTKRPDAARDKTSHLCLVYECNKSFNNKKDLIRHQAQTHSNEAPFECWICYIDGQVAEQDTPLKKNRLRRLPHKKSSYKKYNNRRNLVGVEKVDENPRISFNRKDNLKRHLIEIHRLNKKVASQLANEARETYLKNHSPDLVKPSDVAVWRIMVANLRMEKGLENVRMQSQPSIFDADHSGEHLKVSTI